MGPVSPSPIEKILHFVATDLFVLLAKYKYRIVNSQVEEYGDAFVDLASDNVIARLVCDRRQFFIILRSPTEPEYREHSLDIICRVLAPGSQRISDSFMTPENGAFLCEVAPKLNRLFGKRSLSNTLKKINNLQNERARVMFDKPKKARVGAKSK